MNYIFKKGATSQSIELYIVDSTDGTPETGVLWNTAGIDLKYRRKDAAVVPITEAALTTPVLTDTWETGGFLEIGNGVYRLDLPNAALASAAGIDRVVVFGTVTGMVVLPVTIHLVAIDLDDTVRAGLTALPNAVPQAAGGMVTSTAGAEFDSRTLPSADYVVVGDTIAAVTSVTSVAANGITATSMAADSINAASIKAGAIDNATFAADVGSTAHATNIISLAARKGLDDYDPPTNTEFNLRSLPSADYVVVGDTIAGVTLVATCTTNTDMVGTNGAALAASYTATRAGYLDELAAANLPTDIADIPTVAEFEARTIVSADYVVVGDTIAAVTVVNGLAANVITAAAIATDAIDADALAADAITEIWAKAMTDLAQGAPSATASVLTAINYLYEAWRNKTTTTATLITVMKDDGTTGLVKSTISDDATTFSKAEFISGA